MTYFKISTIKQKFVVLKEGRTIIVNRKRNRTGYRIIDIITQVTPNDNHAAERTRDRTYLFMMIQTIFSNTLKFQW